MKVLIQRVKEASVTVEGRLISSINYGYLLLVGFNQSDDETILQPMIDKIINLRICEDENQKMNLSIQDIKGELLSVSQFTLYADCVHGRRPSFTDACDAQRANELYQRFNELLTNTGLIVKSGIFQADMKVSLINDGPVTIMLDSDIIIKK